MHAYIVHNCQLSKSMFDNPLHLIKCKICRAKLTAIVKRLQIDNSILSCLHNNYKRWSAICACKGIYTCNLNRIQEIEGVQLTDTKHALINEFCISTHTVNNNFVTKRKYNLTFASRSSILTTTSVKFTLERDVSSSKRMASATRPRNKCSSSSLKSFLYVINFLKLCICKETNISSRIWGSKNLDKL